MSKNQTPISPAEQLKRDLASQQREVNELQEKVKLSTLADQIEDLNTKVNNLSRRVNDLRNNNYIFDTNLETKAHEYLKKWQPIHTNLKFKLNQESSSLKTNMKTLEDQLVKASTNISNLSFSRQIINSLKVSTENLSEKISASEKMIRGMFDSFERDLNIFIKNLTNIEWTVKEYESSNIKLFPHEFLIMGVKSTWTRDGEKDKDDPEGRLFLTDQRIIFEQKQEVATKKFLFITRERELIQEILVDIPLSLVENINTSKQGIFKNQDYLEINFASGAQYPQTEFHLQNQDCEDWKALINKVLSGDYDKNRTEDVDQEVLEKIKNAPTICPQCGATLNVQIIRGMDQFTCEFCGVVIKL